MPAQTQTPVAGQLNIDHVAHFVPHIDAASAALDGLGFTLTPFSAQSHRLEPGGPVVPAGTGNRCVMLQQGYLEFLTPTGDTPNAAQLRTAIKRYTGVHVIVFGTSAPDADHARLDRGGFRPLEPIALQRQIGTEAGEGTARFTVLRTQPGVMPEGRIQFCRHHTPELVWQQRWMTHANGATGIAGVLLCVADPAEAAQRYTRYSGLLAQSHGAAWRIDTARGYLLFVAPDALERRLGVTPPSMPWNAGYVLQSANMAATGMFLRKAGCDATALDGDRLLVRLPDALGGVIVFEPRASRALNFD